MYYLVFKDSDTQILEYIVSNEKHRIDKHDFWYLMEKCAEFKNIVSEKKLSYDGGFLHIKEMSDEEKLELTNVVKHFLMGF